MKEPNGTALIVARPGELRDGLRALLVTTGKVGHISQADDGPAALAIIGQLCPQVAVLDWNLPAGDLPTLVRRIKAECPETKCLVLADGVEQQREAESAGADVTVLKGFPAARLVQTLSRLLQGRQLIPERQRKGAIQRTLNLIVGNAACYLANSVANNGRVREDGLMKSTLGSSPRRKEETNAIWPELPKQGTKR